MSDQVGLAKEDDAFVNTQRFQDIKTAAYDNLLTRIEELGAEFGRWSRAAIQQFVNLDVDGFVRLRRIPLNENEVRLIADALTKELAGLGPLEDLLADGDVEDILINGYNDVFVSRHGVLQRETLRFTDNNHLLRIVRRILAPPRLVNSFNIEDSETSAPALWSVTNKTRSEAFAMQSTNSISVRPPRSRTNTSK